MTMADKTPTPPVEDTPAPPVEARKPGYNQETGEFIADEPA